MSNNIFDLSKRRQESAPSKISQEEQESLLNGYIEVPYEQWGSIKKYWHIRYERNGGLFRKGGFIKSVWAKTDKDGESKKYIQLIANVYAKPDKTTNPAWVIQLDTIQKIWRRITNKEKSSDGFIKQDVDKLKKEVAWLKALVIKLHNLQPVQSK